MFHKVINKIKVAPLLRHGVFSFIH